ncbi:unnamed protein product [Mytilus edulis]|uniref:B box-type domain-containing protein n=1 Tax=Mytilus edulis TaxID=6550 RepID=A0A8S3T1Z6_MYTED|nr:unnamed protein product [Mytilus edulis]
MAASDPYCLVCEQKDVVKPAVIWCNICEGLCDECSFVHKFIKGCLSPLHNTISADDRKKLPTFITEIKQICEDHSEPFVLYCAIHDEPCCSQCSAQKHSTCSGFRSLEIMTKNAAESASLTDIENGIDRLSKNCDIVRSNRETALTKYQEEVNTLKSSLKSLRGHMIKVFDQMEIDMIDKVEKIGKPYTEEIESITSVMTNLSLRLRDMRNALTTMQSFGTSYQIFAGTRKLRTELDKEERILEALLIDGKILRQKDITFKFDFASLPALVKKAVDFETEETNCTLQLLGNQSIQTQLVRQNIYTIEDIKFNKVNSFDLSNPESERFVVGCAFLHERGFAFTDWSDNKEVVICTEGGVVVRTFQQRDKPYGISRYSQHSIAITIPNLKESILIDLETAEEKGKIAFKKRCWGVTSNGTQRYIRAYECGIQCVDDNGKSLKSLPVEGFVTHVAYSNGKLYYTQHDPNLVKCCTIDGDAVWQLSTDGEPYGITVGKHGFVIVALKTSNKVIVISPNGISTKDVTSSFDGYSSPYAVDYDLDRDKLLVAKDNTGVFEVYDVSFE